MEKLVQDARNPRGVGDDDSSAGDTQETRLQPPPNNFF